MLKADLTKDAVRFLKKRDSKQFLQLTNDIITLCGDPRPADSESIGDGLFRKDCGEFRIIYKFDAKALYVSVIANRNDDTAYKELDRKRP